jgi:hypothetical protein
MAGIQKMDQPTTSLKSGEEPAVTSEMDLNSLWGQVVANFRQACILKHAGKPIDAEHLLRSELPRWISAWSKLNPKPAREQEQELRAMFLAEQKRIFELWSAQDVLAASLTHRVVGSLSNLVAQELKTLVASQLVLGNSTSISAAQTRLLTRSQGPYMRIAPSGERWDDSIGARRPEQSKARLSLDDVPGAIDAVLAEQDRIVCPRTNSMAQSQGETPQETHNTMAACNF